MKTLGTRWLGTLLVVAVWACGVALGQSAPVSGLVAAKNGDVFYTRFSLFYEQGHHLTTNYRRGTLLPVNTPVTFVKSGRNEILVTLPSGEELSLENVRDYSGEDLEGVFRRTLSSAETDLTQFSDLEKTAIEIGQPKIGMTKAAILIALGYPPKHQTPSLESDNWRYWSSRYGTFIVRFDDGKLVDIVN